MIPAEFVQPDEFCGLTGSRQRAVWRRWLVRIGVRYVLTQAAAAAHAGLAGWRQWAAWESGERRPPAATWELWLLRMRMHPDYELLPRRGYSPASGPAQARTG